MKSLIIFAGAGASRGVSSSKYPTTTEFRERLPKEIADSQLYIQIMEHIKRSGVEGSVDIEHVLWELGQLNQALRQWTGQAQFTTHLLTSNLISVIAQSNNSGPAVHGQFTLLQSIATRLQDQINERVYDFYSQVPDEKELKRSWLPLLKVVKQLSFERVDIFTTNYDLVIESAIEVLDDLNISMGFSHGALPGINLRAWDDATDSDGLLTKLHGSVDWKLGRGSTDDTPVIRRGHPEFDGDHSRRLIIYPGFKGAPAREPFIRFHEYFRRRLEAATHILFIGFAFRDEFINSLLTSSLRSSASIAVLDPASTLPSLSFLSGATHFKQGFGVSRTDTLLASGGLSPFALEELEEWFR